MRQSWRDLLFLHFPCDPAEIAPLLPPGLVPDTFPDASGDEKAWIGLVPFMMRDVRWTFAPRVPGTHTFPETNVRTYVAHTTGGTGVWFFSLDAMNRLAVRAARAGFALPYRHARMALDRVGDHVRYSGRRDGATYEVEASLGPPLAASTPGTLQAFLVERYRLFVARRGRLFAGDVRHAPYALREARIERLEESLVQAVGIVPREFQHAVFSEGLDVEVFPLKALGNSAKK